MTATATVQPPQIPGYQYVADIAIGGYSVVYRYRQRSPRRDVAVKVLTDFGGADVSPEQRDAEANMMAKLGNHPNIVQVIVADVASDGRHYIIMPYYPGRSLAETVAEGPLAVGKVLRVGVQMAGALDAAHRLGLLHRDIKPANILLDEYGTPRLTDFGIAGWAGPDQRAGGGLSLPWSPPEVVAGYDNQRSADLYSLGATLFHLLVGQPPHARPGDTREALEWRIQNAAAPATGREDMPAEFEALLARMLAQDPQRRPESASMIAAALRDIETTLGGPASSDAPWRDTSVATTVPRFTPTAPRPGPAAAAAAAAPGVPVSEATVLRRHSNWTSSGARPAPRTRAWAWILGASATLACAVVIGGIVWSASSAPPATAPSAATGASQNAAVDDLPPGLVTITGTRSGSTATFRWTYDGAQAQDTFLWRNADGSGSDGSGSDGSGAAAKKVNEPQLSLPDPGGRQLCIQVKVVRIDGTGSPDWSPTGCVS